MMSQFNCSLVFSVMLVCSTASLAGDLTQSWYSIAFDLNGNKTDITYNHPVISDTVVTSLGDGYNGTWYHYAALDRDIMWFHNGPYSASQRGYYELLAFFGAINGSTLTSFEMAFGYTTPQWTNGSTPPLPDNVGDSTTFDLYTDTAYTSSESGRNMGSSSREVHSKNYVTQYNPEWFYISAQGRNVVLYRYLIHGADDATTTPKQGACCNQATGDCYITTTGSCSPGYTYLGDNSTCASCTVQQSNLDFGDAPSSYKVKLVDNGARHYLSPGVMLGQSISGESDGQPSQNANLDTGDDGVEFETSLVVGQNTNLKVTASTLGAINAWLDLNGDGDWDDLQEQILIDEPVAGGTTSLSFFVPESATLGPSFMRFRFNTAGGLGANGLATDGEVEDYAVTITDESPQVTPLTPVPPANKMTTQWSQPAQRIDAAQPILNGWGVLSSYGQGPLVSDDWTVSQTVPIQGFRWWGTFDQWVLSSLPEQRPNAFHIGIWSNNPTLDGPGTLLWETICNTWHWALAGQLQDGQMAYEFSAFLSQDEWFIPEQLTDTTTYWVSISAIYNTSSQSAWPWHWLTTPESHDSPAIKIQSVANGTTGQGTWPPTLGNLFLSGDYVTLPSNTGWDMAFELITNKPIASSQIQGDINGDGEVNGKDLALLISLL